MHTQGVSLTLVLVAWMNCDVTSQLKGKEFQWVGMIFSLLMSQSQGPHFRRQGLGKTANSFRLSSLMAQVSRAMLPEITV